ncbi:50S ribosomal protein L17 [Candidatus Poribacteria bacterium]|nr:50S ribosomal protein L17 [Candidatus Poribacteria bacterium]
MRHRKSGRKLGRTSSHRKALFSNQATVLFEHEQIRTTLPKCLELRRVVEKLITLAKRSDLHARRQAAQMIHDHIVLQKLFNDIGPRYEGRNGGYTRIIRGELRRGDGAQMAYIQLV